MSSFENTSNNMSQVYFENIEQVIMSSLAAAENRLYVAVAWFTNNNLFVELRRVLQKGIQMKILILDDILNRNEFGLDFGELVKYGAEIRFANSKKGTMHNKFCVIDNKVITGSYNWTYRANKNHENIIVIDEPDVASSYSEQFESLFNMGRPIITPYEYLKWTDIHEGDFSELKRNILRDVIAKNDEYKEHKKEKLINLDHAFKSGDIVELTKACSLPIEESYRTITDVLTSRSSDYELMLWEENITGEPYKDVDGHIVLERWIYIPHQIKEDKYHQTYVKGTFMVYSSLDDNDVWADGYEFKVYDEEFINVIRVFWNSKSYGSYKLIPERILVLKWAKFYFYPFPTPMFNKSQPRVWNNNMPRTVSAINLFGIAKENYGNNVVFFEGWDPKKRGEKIEKRLFLKA